MSSHNHALVFGASGLAGWAIVNQLLENYPTEGTFQRVTGVVNRLLTVEDAHWPPASADRPQLHLASGVNLLEGSVDEFASTLKEKVPQISSVTHVFYFAYKQDADPHVEVTINRGMFECAVGALNALCHDLNFIVFPSGTRGYAIYVPGGLLKAPLVETMDPIPEPYRSQGWYYAFQRILRDASKDKSWTWCDIRPDTIVGFAPHGSTYSLTSHWATYLSLYAHVEGEGAKIPFPGSEGCYTALSTDASAATIAKASIWASLHPEETGGQLFNIADEVKPLSMRDRWPRLAAYFGLEGTGPAADTLPPGEYCKKHAAVLEKNGIKAQVFQGDVLDSFVGFHLSFDRQLSIDKIRAAGFDEEVDAVDSWLAAFDKFKSAGLIL